MLKPGLRLRALLIYEAVKLLERVQDLSDAEHAELRQTLLDELSQAPLSSGATLVLRALELRS